MTHDTDTDTDTDVTITDNAAASRYEARVGDAVAGFADYDLAPGRIVFTHTEVDDAYEGQGVASRLIQFALDDVRSRALAVVPQCEFVRSYIAEHMEYADLVA